MRDRVTIGTCANPAEAALVRAALGAHGIEVLINAENHANLLGGMGGAFVPLHIFVSKDDAEEAAALLADVRAQNRADELDDRPDPAEEAELARELASRNRRFRIGVLVMFGIPYAVMLPTVANRPAFAIGITVVMLGAMLGLMRAGTAKPNLPKATLRR